MGNGFGPFTGANAVSIFDASSQAPPAAPGGGASLGGGPNAPRNYSGQGFLASRSCLEEALRAMQYREYIFSLAAVSTGFKIDSDTVKDGCFWYVLACCVESISPGVTGQSNANILLMPPNSVGAPVQGGAKPIIDIGVRIDNQNAVTGGTVSLNPNGLAVDRPFVVPPRWFVRFSGATAAGGGPFSYAFRLALAELPLNFDALELL